MKVGDKNKTGRICRILLFAFSILISASGCGFSVGLSQRQKSAVADFGGAASSIGATVPNELQAMRTRTIHMRIAELKVIDPAPDGWPGYNQLDKNFEPETVQARIAAAQVLSAYGNLLKELATSSDQETLSKAADNFKDSVSILSNKKLSSGQLGAVGQAVEVVAGFYIERRRLSALKTVVLESHDQATTICKLLAADFDPNGGNLMSALKNAAVGLRADADERLKKAGEPHPSDYGDLVSLYYEGQENQQYANTVGAKIADTINHIEKVNDDLVQSLQAPEFSFSSPAELKEDVKEISSLTQIFGK